MCVFSYLECAALPSSSLPQKTFCRLCHLKGSTTTSWVIYWYNGFNLDV